MNYSLLVRLTEKLRESRDIDAIKVTDDPKEIEITSSPVEVVTSEELADFDTLFSSEPEMELGGVCFYMRLAVYQDRPYIFNKAVMEDKKDIRYSAGDLFHLEGPSTGYVERLKEDPNTLIIPDHD
jgi:hypothetical protein|nr:MAG TPA: hypothetical protein [Caudoviricetes sp.]